MVYNHSVKVPTQYRRAAAIFKKAISERKSVKTQIFEEKHANISKLQAVLKRYSDNRGSIESIIEKSKILEENPRLDPSLCRVLITELVFGTKNLQGEAKPITVVKSYNNKFLEILGNSVELADKEKAKTPRPRYVRVNTNLISMQEAFDILKDEGWKLNETIFDDYEEFLKAVQELGEEDYLRDMHVSNLLVFSTRHKQYWARHGHVKSKHFILQDKGTCLVGELLQPPPNSIVLDLCAAPGMKTVHLSNIMQNQGTIYSVEQDAQRYTYLCDMVSQSNATIVKPINRDALTITQENAPDVEYILVDPSCSGSGMQNRLSLSATEQKDSDRLYKLAGLQIKILRHAMKNFPKVKRIAYCTCSLYEEENEQVIEKCLSQCPDFKLLSAKKSLRNKWKNTGKKEYKKIGKNCIYALPNDDLTDGIFIAIFEKINQSNDE